MSKINILDPRKIDHWLESLARAKDEPRAKETTRLLSIALKRHFLTNEKTAALLTEIPENAPAWMANKWDVTGGPFHRFAPEQDPGLEQKMNHIVDWLVAAQVNDAPFLKDTLSGKPKLLLHIKSVDDACEKADKHSAARRKKFAKAAAKRPDDGRLHVMDLKDGMRIVEVATKEAREREGSLMQHCVGDGAYEANIKAGKTRIYSLRDKDNQPYATFEVGMEDNSLKQCKGKQNKAPAEKYMPYVEDFVRKKKFTLKEAACYTHLLQDKEGRFTASSTCRRGSGRRGTSPSTAAPP